MNVLFNHKIFFLAINFIASMDYQSDGLLTKWIVNQMDCQQGYVAPLRL